MDGEFLSSDDDVQFCSDKSVSTPPSSWEAGSDPQTPSDKSVSTPPSSWEAGSDPQTPSHTLSTAKASGQTKKRFPRKCAKCRNHNQTEMWKGHKRFCPWKDCYCKLCILVDQRRDNTKKGARLRREQLQEQQHGHVSGNEVGLPSSGPICRLDEQRLEETLAKILRSTSVRSSSVLFLAVLRSCAMDVSQAVATIDYAWEEMKSIAPNLTNADFTARYAIFPKASDLSFLRQSHQSIMTTSLAQNNIMSPMTHTALNLSYPRYTGALYNMHLPLDVATDDNILHQRYGNDVNYVAPPNVALLMNREQQATPSGNYGYVHTTPVLDQDIYTRGSYYAETNGEQATPNE